MTATIPAEEQREGEDLARYSGAGGVGVTVDRHKDRDQVRRELGWHMLQRGRKPPHGDERD